MRVLLADSGWKMRGGQWQTLYLAEGLRRAGHEVTLLARHGGLLWELASQSRLTVRQVGFSTMLLLSRAHDVVHVQDASSHTAAALTSRVPFVVSRRVLFPVQKSWASQKKYARAAGYLAVSQAVSKELRKAGVSPEKIRVVYDGVPDIEPAGYEKHVAGFKSPDPGKLNQLMSDACFKAGAPLRMKENLAEALQSGLLFLYLSQSEGLGSAALLAMAAGLPIVASRVGGLPEAIDEGFSGLLVPNDVDAVAEAVETIFNDRNLALRLSENARRRYLQMFTVERMVEQTIEAYRELLHA